jgi:hypothetical protein
VAGSVVLGSDGIFGKRENGCGRRGLYKQRGISIVVF